MILGTVIALLVAIAILTPRPRASDVACPHCGHDFDEESPTTERVDG